MPGRLDGYPCLLTATHAHLVERHVAKLVLLVLPDGSPEIVNQPLSAEPR